VAADVGFLQQGQAAPYQILPDYTIPLLGETGFSTIVAGAIGTLVVAVVAIGLGRMMRRSSSAPTTASETR
jgi:cobalt/nickel transport system permease protein